MTMEFKSQICTTRKQSEQLIALGLKKETADMMLYQDDENNPNHHVEYCIEYQDIISNQDKYLAFKYIEKRCVSAWSLHRLLSLIPKDIEFQVIPMCGRNYTLPIELQITSELDICYIKLNREEFQNFHGTDIYDSAIRCIEWLINEGYFNKDYLE